MRRDLLVIGTTLAVLSAAFVQALSPSEPWSAAQAGPHKHRVWGLVHLDAETAERHRDELAALAGDARLRSALYFSLGHWGVRGDWVRPFLERQADRENPADRLGARFALELLDAR